MTMPTIFLVEDNDDDVELTIKAIQESHMEVQIEIARDGAEAVSFLDGGPKSPKSTWPPHVIILDLNLPKLSGLEVLRRLRCDTAMSNVPVIVLTTSDDELERLDCYREGSNSFIRKPV